MKDQEIKKNQKEILLNAVANLEGRAINDCACAFCNIPQTKHYHESYCLITASRNIIENIFKNE